MLLCFCIVYQHDFVFLYTVSNLSIHLVYPQWLTVWIGFTRERGAGDWRGIVAAGRSFNRYHGCLSLFFYHSNWSLSFTSLRGMFLFFKWLLASFLSAIRRLVKWAHQTVLCTNESVRAGGPAPAFHCKAPAEVTGRPQRASHGESSGLLWSGHNNKRIEVAEAFSHVPARVDNTWDQQSTKGRRYKEDKSKWQGDMGGEWLTPACAWVPFSKVDILTTHTGRECERKTEIGGNTKVQVCVRLQTDTNEDRGEPSVVNGITGSWEVRW